MGDSITVTIATTEMKNKILEWIKRYLLADIISTVLSLGTAWLIMEYGDDRVLAAFIGSAVASLSFYLLIAFSDVRKSIKQHKQEDKTYKIKSFLIDFRNLIIEFGPAEILDVIAVRPFFMYLIPILIGNFLLGTFIGKMISDAIFFAIAIIMYELRKKHLD
ncbi:MAG: hypothetical protein DRJ10_10370 [Bacteroidetes bacterium]|nr:MAG: hypothetical protein DRJ10_10370 [Bacteroidota bacterium]